jgi:hypothetical protein
MEDFFEVAIDICTPVHIFEPDFFTEHLDDVIETEDDK